MPTEDYLNDLMPVDRLPETKKPLVIYHGKCQDGFTAAWAIWGKHPDWEFYPGVHGDPPPNVTGRDVYMVDFSYKRPVLLDLMREAASITIIDHHKSAEADLAGLELESKMIHDYCPVRLVFDMGHSGARLAWDVFRVGELRPQIINYVEDRDLWKWEVPNSAEVSAVIFSYDYDFKTWNTLANEIESPTACAAMILSGKAIARKQTKDIKELLQKVTQRGLFGGFDVPMANMSYVYSSEAGNLLAQGEHFALTYFETPIAFEVSLRSVEGGHSVSDIAILYGGGGHEHAAGCRIPKVGNLGFQGSVDAWGIRKLL